MKTSPLKTNPLLLIVLLALSAVANADTSSQLTAAQNPTNAQAALTNPKLSDAKTLSKGLVPASAAGAKKLTAESQGGLHGGGDGDQAFALQDLVASHPGLSMSEILLKDFEEHAGPGPKITYVNKLDTHSLETYTTGCLWGSIGEPRCMSYKGIEINIGGHSEDEPVNVDNKLSFHKVGSDLGPLVPPKPETQVYELSEPKFFGNGIVENEVDGLKMRAWWDDTTQLWLEMRSVSPKLAVFVTHPLEFNSGLRCSPIALKGAQSREATSADEICSVGYFWLP